MMRWIVIVILAFFSLQVYGQQRNTRIRNRPPSFEEFRAKIKLISDPDSLLSSYTQFAKQIVNRYPDSTLALSDELLSLDQIDLFKRRAYSNLILTSYWYRPNPDSALKFSDKALSLFKELDNKPRVVEVLVNQARLQSQINDYLLAEEKYLTAIEYSEGNELSQLNRENLLKELTSLYVRVGATELALEKYNQLLEIESLTKAKECSVLLNISNAYKRNEQIEQAEEALLKCENIEELNFDFRAALLRSLSDIDRIQGDTEDQIRRLEKAIELEEQNNRRNFITYLFLAKAYLDNSELAKTDSMVTILESLNIQRTAPPARIDFYLLKTKIDIKKELLDQALESSEEAVTLAKRLPPTPLLIDAYKLQAEVFEKKGDIEAAYNVVNQINEVDGYINERGKINSEAMAKVRLQMRAKNDELAQVTSQLGSVKTRNALIIFVLVLIALYAIYRYRIYYLLREERTRIKIARDLHDDLSATLSSISFFSEAAKREYADSDKPGKFLQRIDESAVEAKEKINDIIWAIEPENDDWMIFLSKCKRYAAEMFESKEIAYQIDIDVSTKVPLDIKMRQDFWLIFKEMIINIVRHSEAQNARVFLNKELKRLVLIVSDDGIGISDSSNKSGNGLTNIKYRAEKLNGSISLNSNENDGTEWEFKIPI